MKKSILVFAIECFLALMIIALLGSGCIKALFYVGV